MMRSLLQKASKQPNAPPKNASTTLSLRNWRISLPLLAPNAARIAISFSLAAPRTSSRLAMFAQVIKSTRATATSSNHSMDR